MMNYTDFLEQKAQVTDSGFDPVWMPDFLFPFQRDLTEWAVRRGRAAIFADCGLGKTPMQLVWAQNIVEKTNGHVLIATPLAVSYQVLEEAEKFGIFVRRSTDGNLVGSGKIIVTNYQRLHHFDAQQFTGMVCDESSILKNFNGVTRGVVTEMMRQIPYRLLCTATAAPNDYTELGTSSEALGELGYMDMLSRFFRNARNTSTSRSRELGKKVEWRLKGHAEVPFWRWISSWARSIRKPSDFGYDDAGFVLPPLTENMHVVKANTLRSGMLFEIPAANLREQREERRRTLAERCEKVAELVNHDRPALVWCHLNNEGDRLTQLIDGAYQVKGSDSDEVKEERLRAFAHGEIRCLVTKPKIGAWGLNLQGCSHVTFFPSHSYEQYYQGVRRCWRFGQRNPVTVDIITTEGEKRVVTNLQEKAKRADQMFDALLEHMQDALTIIEKNNRTNEPEVPSWL